MSWFKKYFLNYFWLSIVLILVSILIETNTSNKYCNVFASLLETLGMAAFVAAIFNFTIETTDFIEKIKDCIWKELLLKRIFFPT